MSRQLGPGSARLSGSFDFTGFTKYFRRMATPIRLDHDGVTTSATCSGGGPQIDPRVVAVLLRNADEAEGELTRAGLADA